jgi:hypothetical protein
MINKSLDELKICTIKNIADFDFTPELGAQFGGRPFFVKAGETLIAPEPAAYRLAVNLAKAMLVKQSPLPTIGNGDDRSSLGTWSEEDVEKLIASIMVSSAQEEKAPVLTESDRIAAKIDELNKWKESMEEKISNNEIQTTTSDKADVIAELEKKNIKFDRRQTKASLEKLLNETA